MSALSAITDNVTLHISTTGCFLCASKKSEDVFMYVRRPRFICSMMRLKEMQVEEEGGGGGRSRAVEEEEEDS